MGEDGLFFDGDVCCSSKISPGWLVFVYYVSGHRNRSWRVGMDGGGLGPIKEGVRCTKECGEGGYVVVNTQFRGEIGRGGLAS